mgnify:CR=1 FL=1
MKYSVKIVALASFALASGLSLAQQGETVGQEPRATEQSASPAPEGEVLSSRRRRHHHAAGSGVDATSTDEQGQQPAPKHAAKRTRHPGDRGGAASQQQPKPKNPAPQAQQGDGEAKPKRRRHRGPRGNGDGSSSNGGDPGSGAPSAE